MIKSIIAATREIDDAQAAVAEITRALDPERNLLKNSLGIVSCFSEFEETGVLKAVCDALPFECIGATTCVCAAGEEIDQMLLVVTVLTSDDCAFQTTVIPIDDNYTASVRSSVSALLAHFAEKPALLFGYFPLNKTIGGDMVLEILDQTAVDIPVFGTVAIDHNTDYATAGSIHNGRVFREAAVLGAVSGPVKVSFETANLDENKIRKQKAIITESKGSLLIGVNGKSVREYLREINLGESEFLGLVPFVIDHKDGTKPVARAVYAFTPEGHAVCGGAMPEGATLSIGRVDAEDVLNTTARAFEQLAEPDHVVISYSCIARYLALGLDVTSEAEKLKNAAKGANYHFAYSGGEICPLYDSDGKVKNHFHNYSIVFCKLS